MKRILLVLTLGAALGSPTFAQSTNTPPSGGPPPGHHWGGGAMLTPEEKQELKAAHDKALQDDPTLVTEGDALKAQMKASHESGTPPSDADKAQWKAFHEKMDAAMIKADANVAPILAKLKAAHHHHDGDGPPPAN